MKLSTNKIELRWPQKTLCMRKRTTIIYYLNEGRFQDTWHEEIKPVTFEQTGCAEKNIIS